jgi:sigma-B regulation protein RsbU (phosphoserine phosphatase)
VEPTVEAVCAVVLESAGGRLGVLWFSFDQPHLFDDDARRFITALASQTSQALGRARLSQAQVQTSRRLQQSLLPARLPAIAGLDVAAVYHPLGETMQIGGDFYDLWQVGQDTWMFTVGDACGTGPEASGLGAQVRFAVRALARSTGDLEELLWSLNEVLVESEVAGHESGRFCTAIVGLIKRRSRSFDITMVSGGHPEPVRRVAGMPSELVELRGTLLGILPDITVGCTSVALGPGDTLVCYTDGVVEARRAGDLFGFDRMLRAIDEAPRGATACAGALESAVVEHSGGELRDDMAILVLTVRGEVSG